jgi:hypothetical protein
MKKMKCCEYISRLLPWVWSFTNVPAYFGWDILAVERDTIMILHCLTRKDQTRMKMFIKVKNTCLSYKSFTCASKTIFVSYSKKSFITLAPIGMRRVEEKRILSWSDHHHSTLASWIIRNHYHAPLIGNGGINSGSEFTKLFSLLFIKGPIR